MKFLIAVLVVIVGMLAWLYRSQSLLISDQSRQIQDLVTKSQSVATLETQERCARQSHAQFTQLGWEKEPSAEFESHYNTKMGKCFMSIMNTDSKTSTIWDHRTVMDAFEGKVFGAYSWHTDPVKKYWEVAPVICEVTLPSGEKQLCKSEDEFQELVKIYMQ